MTADYCKKCVWWILNRCDGMEKPTSCPHIETYEDWENLDEMVLDFFEE